MAEYDGYWDTFSRPNCDCNIPRVQAQLNQSTYRFDQLKHQLNETNIELQNAYENLNMANAQMIGWHRRTLEAEQTVSHLNLRFAMLNDRDGGMSTLNKQLLQKAATSETDVAEDTLVMRFTNLFHQIEKWVSTNFSALKSGMYY